MVFALKEDRMRTDRYNASSLRRALHELAGSHMVGNPELGLRFTTPLQSVSKELELHRLMGRWHVLAIIPSSTLEKGSHNYIEDLCWDGDLGHIQVSGSFADASGKRRTIKRTAWVRDLKTCAEWRVTASVSGINLDPWSLQILHCPDDYTAFMAGDSMRMSLKIYGRDVDSLGDGQMDELLQIARDAEFDLSSLQRMGHEEEVEAHRGGLYGGNCSRPKPTPTPKGVSFSSLSKACDRTFSEKRARG